VREKNSEKAVYAGMHAMLYPVRKFQRCANAVAPAKLESINS